MKITVVPASTQAGKATIEALLNRQDPPHIRAVYRDTSKAPAQFTDHRCFHAVYGGLDEELALDVADSDAVFYVPPPTYDEQVDSGDHATRMAIKVNASLQQAPNVRRLVVLSAMGAQHSSGISILKINHITDKVLATSVPEVLIVRPGWFQENWAEALVAAKGERLYFETHFTPVDHKIPMVSLVDAGKVIAESLLETGQALPSCPQVSVLHGP